MRMPPDTAEIRDARVDDIATIADFNIALAWESEQLRLESERVLRGVAEVVHGRAEARYFMATLQEIPVGQLMLTREWSDWRNGWLYWIQSVYVLPSARNRGIFRQLYESARDFVQADPRAAGLRLYVEEHNHSALQTYARLGMQSTGYRVMEWLKDSPTAEPPA